MELASNSATIQAPRQILARIGEADPYAADKSRELRGLPETAPCSLDSRIVSGETASQASPSDALTFKSRDTYEHQDQPRASWGSRNFLAKHTLRGSRPVSVRDRRTPIFLNDLIAPPAAKHVTPIVGLGLSSNSKMGDLFNEDCFRVMSPKCEPAHPYPTLASPRVLENFGIKPFSEASNEPGLFSTCHLETQNANDRVYIARRKKINENNSPHPIAKKQPPAAYPGSRLNEGMCIYIYIYDFTCARTQRRSRMYT